MDAAPRLAFGPLHGSAGGDRLAARAGVERVGAPKELFQGEKWTAGLGAAGREAGAVAGETDIITGRPIARGVVRADFRPSPIF